MELFSLKRKQRSVEAQHCIRLKHAVHFDNKDELNALELFFKYFDHKIRNESTEIQFCCSLICMCAHIQREKVLHINNTASLWFTMLSLRLHVPPAHERAFCFYCCRFNRFSWCFWPTSCDPFRHTQMPCRTPGEMLRVCQVPRSRWVTKVYLGVNGGLNTETTEEEDSGD